ncbi:uncharacterized protein LOC128987513 [Macrosteles quadrilineatus]|uniref:uncharacterized protein LOC128987513 n=1 Tax=Macrosteles quadrilineatus TaxID=74068 RepID=UPI0023E18D97|nr:uncharacterized protein LOC128987513 [Macrosteles quadrilineatus]
MSRPNSDLDQLIELFPNVSEEFLSGIYNAYVDDEPTVEQLVEVICSFEFPLTKETTKEDHLETGSVDTDTTAEVVVDVSPKVICAGNSNVCQPLVNESTQKSSLSNGKLLSAIVNGKDLSERNVIMSEAENTVFEEPCSPIPQDKYEPNNNSFENFTEVKASTSRSRTLLVGEVLLDTIDLSIGDEDDSSPECFIKYLVKENDVLSEDENDSPPECMIQFLVKDDVLSGDEDDSPPECFIKYPFLLAENDVLEVNNISTQSEEAKQLPDVSKESKEVEQASDSKKLTNSSSFLKATPTPRRRRNSSSKSTVSNCSAKQARLRSCKVKNEEERLRRKLVNQNRLLREKLVKNTTVVAPSQFQDPDKKYALLCNIFSDANPDYLLSQCKLLKDQDSILAFISKNLELKNYPKTQSVEEEPKLAQPVEEEPKLMEEFHCTVAQFLEAIPDPLVEFSSAGYIRTGYKQNAEIYLKARYQGISDKDIKESLEVSGYNLTEICAQFEREGHIPIPQVLEYTPLHHPANVFFHQEVWYIEHKNEVQQYLDSAIEAARFQEEINRPPPPPVDEVFECEVCAEEIVEYINLGTCEGPVGHLFCVDCIKRSAEIKIGEGETSFPCLMNCGAVIPLRTVQELLPSHMVEKLMDRIQEEEIRRANIAGVETCPFCPYAYGPGEETLFICQNPTCMKLSCRICRKEDHSPDMCEIFKEEDEERARLIIENRMTEALMRTCHSCNKNFVKSSGCNKMICNCGAMMCYVCRQPVKDYSHFNGEGGDNFDRCPLFSQDVDLHVRPVAETAQQVFNEIAANNPQLNLDRTKLIPK